MLNVVNPYTFGGDTSILPYRVDVLAWSSADGVSGMTYTRNQSSSNLGGGSALQASAADADDGDYMEWDVLTAAGTYRLDLVYMTAANYAVVDVLIDGSSIGTFDAYSASLTRNVVGSVTGISMTAGHHTVRVAANGKNASSTDYFITPQSVTLTRTGA